MSLTRKVRGGSLSLSVQLYFLLPCHSFTVADNRYYKAGATSTPRCALTTCCSEERASNASGASKPSWLSDGKDEPDALCMPFSRSRRSGQRDLPAT